ncbi:MAG: hypothetical protein ACK4Z0_10010 [Sphingomonadaceae bacterium]
MSGRRPARLLMIYNADGGLVNGALDLMHKIVSPSTYACRLCELTYGTLGMKRDWRATVEALPLPVRFLHRDEWLTERPGDATPLPAILVEEVDGGLETLVSAAEFEGVADLASLKALLAARLAAVGEG